MRYCPGGYSPGLLELFNPNSTGEDGLDISAVGDILNPLIFHTPYFKVYFWVQWVIVYML